MPCSWRLQASWRLRSRCMRCWLVARRRDKLDKQWAPALCGAVVRLEGACLPGRSLEQLAMALAGAALRHPTPWRLDKTPSSVLGIARRLGDLRAEVPVRTGQACMIGLHESGVLLSMSVHACVLQRGRRYCGGKAPQHAFGTGLRKCVPVR